MSDAPIAYFDDNGVAVFRASAIGSCEAALVHSLRGMEPSPPPESMMRRFEDGHLHEPAILNHLRKMGWTIDEAQKELVVSVSDQIRIVGHIDGLGEKDGLHAVVECKALSDSGYKKWVKEGFEGFPRYSMQISVYMNALKLPAVFAVKNKNSGEVDVQFVEAPPFLLAKLKAKAIRVVKVSHTDKTPACPKVYDYPCPYFHLHEGRDEGKARADDADLGDELNDLCDRYLNAKASEKNYKEMAEQYRARLLEEIGEIDGGRTSLYEIKRTVSSSRRLNTGKLRAAFPDLSQFEEVSESTRLDVKPRGDV